jgi:hypothetical protein
MRSAIKSVEEFLDRNPFACEPPCLPLVQYRIMDPDLPSASIGSAHGTGPGLGFTGTSGGPEIGVSVQLGGVYLVATARWEAWLVCRKTEMPETRHERDPKDLGWYPETHVGPGATLQEGADLESACPSWYAYGFGRFRFAWRIKWENRDWAPPTHGLTPDNAPPEWFQDKTQVRSYINAGSYQMAARMALEWLGTRPLCPPSCQQTKTKITLAPFRIYEEITDRQLRLNSPDYPQVHWIVSDCLWTARKDCSQS